MNCLKRSLKSKMKGKDVELLQTELRKMGFNIKDKKGYFGKDTKSATIAFQSYHKLHVTGEIDEKTFRHIIQNDDELQLVDKYNQQELEFIFTINLITGSYFPLVKELNDLRKREQLKSASDLAKLTEKDWAKIIRKKVNGKPIGIPADTPGKNRKDKIDNYAQALAGIVEDSFPTAKFLDRMSKNDMPKKSDVVSFLNSSKDFNLENANEDNSKL